MDYTLNIKGRLMSLNRPRVMGIVNVTPDSFYADSRCQTEEKIRLTVARMVAEGAAMIDVGACSTRPGASPVTESEERERLRWGLSVVQRVLDELPPPADGQEAAGRAVVSVDTFRPDVARMAVEEFGADIVNDVGAAADAATPVLRTEMFRMVSRLRVPYILMSTQPTIRDILLTFAEEVQRLRDFGQKDIILDPGFGFGKTLEQNFAIMNELEKLQVMELPVLVGVSRKSMIYKLLGVSPEESLNGTTVLNTLALTKGASILRVHDVGEAVECCKIVKKEV